MLTASIAKSDPLEDALAARDDVHWRNLLVRHLPLT